MLSYQASLRWIICTCITSLITVSEGQHTCNVLHCDPTYCNDVGCIKCERGYYLSGTSCSQCRSYCEDCVSYDNCTECDRGKYGTKCDGTCRSTCPTCKTYNECNECIAGRHGTYCQSYCSKACIDILCEQSTGKCTQGCVHGYFLSGDDCIHCPVHCTRCTDASYCNACITGFFGNVCETPCSKSCLNNDCDKVSGECTSGCAEGYHLDGDTCRSCPYYCVRCLSQSICSECKTGYWGQACKNSCPISCSRCTQDGQCIFDVDCDVSHCKPDHCSGGSCIQCEDEYYLSTSGPGYCSSCRTNCLKCTNYDSCTDCVYGRYGTKCESRCRSTCRDCLTSTECTECIPGQHGAYCQSYCPLGCIDILCDKDSAKCIQGCMHGYYLQTLVTGDECYQCPESCIRCSNASYCSDCNTGYWGVHCENSCPISCKNHNCDKEFGRCTEGCNDGYFLEGDTCLDCPYNCLVCDDLHSCSKCKTGYWGSSCEAACPVTCNRCTINGQCLTDSNCNVDHCDVDYCYEGNCIKCADGYYLSSSGPGYCSSCPTYCTKCTSYYTCTECDYGRYGTKCESGCRGTCRDCSGSTTCTDCIQGQYGSYCQNSCPLGCIDISCEKTSGTCVHGCIHGYYLSGVECYKCPDGCKRCINNTYCTECKSGYMGSYCQVICSRSCRNKICEKETGICLEGCSEGFYAAGNSCNGCPYTCISCVDTNTCTGCKTGYWGSRCQNHCPSECNRCTQDGQCLTGSHCNVDHCDVDFCYEGNCIMCVDGYYLSSSGPGYCSSCPAYCLKCTSYYTCTECVSGRYGTKCESKCRSTCQDCSGSTTCTDCIQGQYGSYCQNSCPLGCIDIACEKTSGTCVHGCIHGYYLSGDECNKCPNGCKRCINDTYCTECESGYMGSYCQSYCSISCKGNLCEKDSGICLEGCSEGFYAVGNSCNDCPYTCSSCVDPNTCTGCKTGYWGSHCQNHCPSECNRCTQDGQCLTGSHCNVNHCDVDHCYEGNCIKCADGYYLSTSGPGYCSSCRTYCLKCTSYYTCTECVRGRYGPECETRCRSTCLDCLDSTTCTDCIHGRYGSYCQYICPLGCIDILCEKTTGKCVLGCMHGYFLSGGDCNLCPASCKRCDNDIYCTECKTGYFGEFCQNTCSLSCKNQECDKELGICSLGCSDGFYYDGNDCIACPYTCLSCGDPLKCTYCRTGYWGVYCQKECPSQCDRCLQDGQCLSDSHCDVTHCNPDHCYSSSCIKCKDGFYLTGSGPGYCSQCQSYCNKCTDYNSCTECVSGRYGSECKFNCRSTCRSCVSSSQCTECIPGRHGSDCTSYCPLGCINIMCDQTTGKCTQGCKHGFYLSGDDCNTCPGHCKRCTNSSYCTECRDGFFGTHCQNTCPSSCSNGVCEKESGGCSEGCVEGFYLDGTLCKQCTYECVACTGATTCTKCKTGYWGSECQNPCPNACNRCTIEGQCLNDDCDINNCNTAYCSGESCIQCKDGYYLSGIYCSQCPSYCTTCTSSSSCTTCVDGRYGTTCAARCKTTCTSCTSSSHCTSCIPGRHGTSCQDYCPLSCIDILCDKDSGKCIKGCTHGYYQSGDDCYRCPQNCMKCLNSTYCRECVPGYYGDNCQLLCPESCQDKLCHQELGTCTRGCLEGYYIDESSCFACPQRCTGCLNPSTCSACKTGYWGADCQDDCPATCHKCTQNGQCLDVGDGCQVSHCDTSFCSGVGCIKCEADYYLHQTNCYQCPSYCTACASSSNCTECIPGRQGATCTLSCPTVCTDCISSTRCTGCIPGRHGDACNSYCPLGCKNILCDKTSGKCTDGCRMGYYAIGEDCIKCPDQCIQCSNSSYCTTCKANYFGRTCDLDCPESCNLQICDIETGNCTEGCADGYKLSNGYCVQDTSDQQCQVQHCNPSHCFDQSCTKCREGYFSYNMKCSNCPDECTMCTGSNHCEECVSGRHGSACQFHCSVGCREAVCSKDSGFCTEGCNDGYTMKGGNCLKCPINCAKCSNTDTCTMCEEGFWGSMCQYNCIGCGTLGCGTERNCNEGCKDGFFSQITGANQYECVKCPTNCESCIDQNRCSMCSIGYWGETCDAVCNVNCKRQICEKTDGACSDGCVSGYFGADCLQECSPGCEACHSRNTCTGCLSGQFGDVCDRSCSENCLGDMCFRHNGTCIYGCVAGFKGATCLEKMDVPCVDQGQASGQKAESEANGPAIGLGVVVALAVVAIICLSILLLRHRHPKNSSQEGTTGTVNNQVYDSAFNTTDERGVYQQNYRDKTDYFDNPALVGEEQDKGNYNIRRIKHQQGASADRLGDNNDDEMNYSTIDGLSETL